MAKYVKVMKAKDLEIGKSAIVMVGEEEIALFNYKGKYYAIKNQCPHKGGPLGEGRIVEGVLVCPNHEWRFELGTGQSMQNPTLKTRVYTVKLKNANIYIRIGDEEKKVFGKESSALPSTIKFQVPTIQKPRNPEEEL